MSSLQAIRNIDLGRLRVMASAAGAMAVDAIYPPRCLACPEPTDAPHGLCGACWRETHFISGAACRLCGAPIPGEAAEAALCEGCVRRPPGWDFGAAAVVYGGAGRRVVLSFKHGDRLDMVRPLSAWMLAAGRAALAESDVIAPVPLHWRRLLRRRYNQSAELARRIGRRAGRPVAVDLLQRVRATTPQERMDFAARARNQLHAFRVNPRRAEVAAGRTVLLIDDVLTSGATLSACAEALREAGAARVGVLVVARVASDEAAAISEGSRKDPPPR